MSKSIYLQQDRKIYRISLGVLILLFGGYIIYSLVNILIDDIYYDFEFLRPGYTWNRQYFLFHLWLYSTLMIIGGLMTITNKCNKILDFLIIGFLCFFAYTFYQSLSVLNFLMFVICFYYYINNYGIRRKTMTRISFYIPKIAYLLIHIVIIVSSDSLAITINQLIQHKF